MIEKNRGMTQTTSFLENTTKDFESEYDFVVFKQQKSYVQVSGIRNFSIKSTGIPSFIDEAFEPS